MSEYAQQRTGRVEDATRDAWGTDPMVSRRSSSRSTGWTGWIWFAGIAMIVIGAFNAIEGLVALFQQEYYVVGPENLLVFDLTQWGWVHLIIGALVVLTGIALFSGAGWAKLVTVVLTVLNMISQMAFLAVYPVWSTIVIALCVLVIWAIVVHGDETTLES